MSPTPLHGRAGRRADRSHAPGEFRPDERVDLVYLDAPGALAERQAAFPLVGVNDSYTERLDGPAVVERIAQRIGTISATSAGGAEVRPPPAPPGLLLLPRRPAHPERRLSVAEAKWQHRAAVRLRCRQAQATKAPMFFIHGDADGVRLEHISAMFGLKSDEIFGDMRPRSASRLAILPNTTHTSR